MHLVHPERSTFTLPVLLAAGAVSCALANPCAAQSLHGSAASINRMYRQARAERFSFYETPQGVRRAVAAGRLERLRPNSDYTLFEVGYPYVRPATRTFVERLGAQYRAACHEPLEVTSAVRPATRQPANSVRRSVHPTGMAVDLHKPADAKCRSWLRETLSDLEGAGVLEATEEFAPPHFHVAVFATPYTRYVAERERASRAVVVAQTGVSKYRVRRGDALWDIAREYDTTVKAIQSANGLNGATIQPGDVLLIPHRQ
jgi:LysM domain/Family of unknown function (DUF5715)